MLASFLGDQPRLAGEHFSDPGSHLLGVQTEQPGVLPHETLGEHGAAQLIELIVFDGRQKPLGDLEFAGDLLQLEVAPHPFGSQGLAYGRHT